MCGRYASYKHDKLRPIQAALKRPVRNADLELPARFNIAPGQNVLIVRPSNSAYEAVPVKWGLVPSWSKEPKTEYSTINARSEKAATSPAFRSAFKHRRCLVPADGFYEWQALTGSKTKRPYYIHMADGSPFAFAGLWERWEREGQSLDSCTIMTTEPNALMAKIHNRMPVILDPKDYRAWMAIDNDDPGALLKPFPAVQMHADRISTRVNSPKNEGPELIAPLPAD
jgi:putative SOS response-associated peptidase YedK